MNKKAKASAKIKGRIVSREITRKALINFWRWTMDAKKCGDLRKLMQTYLDDEAQTFDLGRVSESVTCFNCNGWGYALLPNGKRDKHCTVCDGSKIRTT